MRIDIAKTLSGRVLPYRCASFAGITQIRFKGYFSPTTSPLQDPCALKRLRYTVACFRCKRYPIAVQEERVA